MGDEKIMLCLDEAIEKRIDMLTMFQYLSEQNNGVVTDEMIRDYGGKYMLHYKKYIKQLNLCDTCIDVFPLSRTSWHVKVYYTNIKDRGIYSIFLKMRMDFWLHPELFELKRVEMAQKYNISPEAVKVFMGYISYASDRLVIEKATQKMQERPTGAK